MLAIVIENIQQAFNRVIRLDPDMPQRIRQLSNKTVRIECLPFQFNLYLQCVDDQIICHQHYQGKCDTTISGTPWAMASLGLGSWANQSSLFAGEVTITGDMEFGQDIKRLIDDFSIDWEEVLSPMMGDVLAHQMVGGARHLLNWGLETGQALKQNFTEFTQEEIKLFPAKEAVKDFCHDVDQLRLAYDRLEARVQNIKD